MLIKFLSILTLQLVTLLKGIEANPHAAKLVLLYSALVVFWYLLTLISRLL
jgi:hypothetical protein